MRPFSCEHTIIFLTLPIRVFFSTHKLVGQSVCISLSEKRDSLVLLARLVSKAAPFSQCVAVIFRVADAFEPALLRDLECTRPIRKDSNPAAA